MIRKILFQIHLWSGLILALPFLILGITGAFLVFDQDIDRALNAQKPPAASVGQVRSYDAIAAAGLGEIKGMRVTTVIAPEKSGAAAQVRLQKRGGGAGGPPQREQTTAWVDPVTLAVLRIDPPRVSPFRWVHQLHGTFLIKGGLGRPLVGSAGVAMFIMGLSGLVLWWPKRGRWLSAFGIAKNAKGYRFHRDLHGAAGIWLWAAFVAVTFTGVYISFPQTMGPAVSAVLPGRDLRATPELPGAKREGGPREARHGEGAPRGAGGEREQRGPKLSFDAIYAAAHKAVPDAALVSIAAPARPGQVVRVTLTQPGWHEGAPSVTVFVNPQSAEVMDVRDPRKFSVGETIQAWQRPLHEGIGLGIVWKILAFLTGLLPPLFVITGVYMWLVKRNYKRRAEAGAPAGAMLEDA